MTNHANTGRRAKSATGLAAGITAGLVGGAAVGMAIGIPGVSGAAATSVSLVQQAGDEVPDTVTGTGADRSIPGDRLRQELEVLVDDGTISSDQADAVADHLIESRPEPGWHRHRPGGPSGRLVAGDAVSDAVTDVLGLDAETIRDELRDGTTLAELAEANGVDAETLVDTLVSEAMERLDAAVESGRLDADRAADLAEKIEERISRRVDGDVPMRDRSGD